MSTAWERGWDALSAQIMRTPPSNPKPEPEPESKTPRPKARRAKHIQRPTPPAETET